MKLAAFAILVVACLAVAVLVLRKPDERVTLSKFIWSFHGKTAPYEFHVESRAGEKLTIVVVLQVNRMNDSDVGTKLTLVGLKKLEIELSPHEARQISGTIDLLQVGDSSMTVSYTLDIKRPNQAPEPTTLLVMPRAFARVTPSKVVAHL